MQLWSIVTSFMMSTPIVILSLHWLCDYHIATDLSHVRIAFPAFSPATTTLSQIFRIYTLPTLHRIRDYYIVTDLSHVRIALHKLYDYHIVTDHPHIYAHLHAHLIESLPRPLTLTAPLLDRHLCTSWM
jgi:hypothetical protein